MPRHDFRPTGPEDKFGVPGQQFPTPNVEDLIIVEDIDIRGPNFRPLEYGTPHDKNSSALLVYQGAVKGDNENKLVRRIYATVRNAQDAYNASLKYSSESNTAPIYIRHYIERRDTYSPLTKGQPLRGLIGLRLTAAGSGYTSASIVSFSGGAGSGAAASAQVMPNGTVAAVMLTNGGTGYTSAPTVSISGGTGAVVTAFIQPATALLVQEEAQPAPGELASLFLSVTRVYETLPGPWIKTTTPTGAGTFMVEAHRRVAAGGTLTLPSGGTLTASLQDQTTVVAVETSEYAVGANGTDVLAGGAIWQVRDRDEETGVEIYSDFFYGDSDYALPATWPSAEVKQINTNKVGYSGNSYSPAHYCIDAKTHHIEGSNRVIIEIIHCRVPSAHVEDIERGVRFPAILTLSADITIPASYAGSYRPPWPGNPADPGFYQLIPHHQNTQPCRRIRTYTIGKSEKLPKVFTVISPGAASKFLPIPEFTIHPPIRVTETIVDGLSSYPQVVEDLPSSTPATYSDRDIICVGASETIWRGSIYCQEVYLASEATPLTAFPDPAVEGYYTIKEPFAITPDVEIDVQPNPVKAIYCTTATGTDQVATIHGTDESGAAIVDTCDYTSSVATPTELEFATVRAIVVNAIADTTHIWGAVNPDYASLRLKGIPPDGHQLIVGNILDSTDVTYTFKNTPTVANDVKRVSDGSRTHQITNLLNSIRGKTAFNTTAQADIRVHRSSGDSGTIDFYSTNATSNTAAPVTDWILDIEDGASNPATWGVVNEWAAGEASEELVTFAPQETEAFDAASLNNPALDDTAPDNNAKALPNLPPVTVLYSDWIAAPTPAATCYIVANATGLPLLRVAYQTQALDPATNPAATFATTVDVTNNSTACVITGYVAGHARTKIVIAGDPQENEVVNGTTLKRAYTGSTGTGKAATITLLQATLVGQLLRGGRVKKSIGTLTGWVRLKITQIGAPKTRAVDAHLEYQIAP